ncbi:hypothetical protein SCOR_05310 [Sulfidibacter corallicola]|uniref:Uncharacterized protein n=1 Tax=Sulfidibacter corallicola TaxID=2818388 RepID=A0A8A4TS02_SULCO|nr:hypothetical protein [Sulfidibacter corallicola]QTD51808.1 hypothetical protein J3U87_05000 [Sulfidibacter corallicola]
MEKKDKELEIESLNLDELDVEELERRLEMSSALGSISTAALWCGTDCGVNCGVDDCSCFGNAVICTVDVCDTDYVDPSSS